MVKSNLEIGWTPKPGRYQCVIPDGKVHLDVFLADGDRTRPETVSLENGEEVELFEAELRILRKSEILKLGFLAPLTYFKRGAKGFERNDDGKIIEIPATEDADNPNLISDDYIYVRIQSFKNVDEFKNHINKITSQVTLTRFYRACEALDTSQSYLTAVNNRIVEVSQKAEDERFVGDIDSNRQNLLTPKLDKAKRES